MRLFAYFCISETNNRINMKSNNVFMPGSALYQAPECSTVILHHEANLMMGSDASSEGWDIDNNDFPLEMPIFNDVFQSIL